MNYLDYTFYSTVYGGSLSESDFNKYMPRAWFIINAMTHGRITRCWDSFTEEQKDAIRMAISAMTESVNSSYATGGKTVLLEIVGQHHVSYAAPTTTEKTRFWDSITPYLSGITCHGESLTYRGIKRRCTPC